MKLTREFLRKLIIESLEEGDLIQGDFGGTPSVDRGVDASVTDIGSKMQEPEDKMPEGAMWVRDAAALVDMLLDARTLDKIAEADKDLAEKLHSRANSILPFVRDYIEVSQREPQPEDFGMSDEDDI
jgi:hypothetical protein